MKWIVQNEEINKGVFEAMTGMGVPEQLTFKVFDEALIVFFRNEMPDSLNNEDEIISKLVEILKQLWSGMLKRESALRAIILDSIAEDSTHLKSKVLHKMKSLRCTMGGYLSQNKCIY